MPEVREYVDTSGQSPFREWFESLDPIAAVKVAVALERLSLGHTAAFKGLGEGISEWKIHFGPDYRIYVGKDGERLVILLGGGTKKRQQHNIENAKQPGKTTNSARNRSNRWLSPEIFVTQSGIARNANQLSVRNFYVRDWN